MKPRTIGIVPARMAASRFPGKPLHPILGRMMIDHVFSRASLYKAWDTLAVATCDREIEDFCRSKGWPVMMTKDTHTRALDRVAEAAAMVTPAPADDDIIVCVQGDEPMLRPDMMDAVMEPLLRDKSIVATILAPIIDNEPQFVNPDTVKIIHNAAGEVLYTSRSPVPYCKPGRFSTELAARRIYGIFAFRMKYLRDFTARSETRLERLEACDSNRILDSDWCQHIAPYPACVSYSVDSPQDIALVEQHMKNDPLWGRY